MKLLQANGLHVQVLQAFFGVLADVFGRETIVERKPAAGRPSKVFRRNLGGEVELLMGVLLEEFAQNLLAFARTVAPGRVEEIASHFHGNFQRPRGFLVVGETCWFRNYWLTRSNQAWSNIQPLSFAG